jgi:hypothetical protein
MGLDRTVAAWLAGRITDYVQAMKRATAARKRTVTMNMSPETNSDDVIAALRRWEGRRG